MEQPIKSPKSEKKEPLTPDAVQTGIDVGASQVPLPELVYREENKALSLIGLVLALVGLTALPITLTIFIGDGRTLLVCVPLAIMPGFLGAILLYFGQHSKQVVPNAVRVLEERMADQTAWLAEETDPSQAAWIGVGEQIDQYWQAQKVAAHLRIEKRIKRLRKRGYNLVLVSLVLAGITIIVFMGTTFYTLLFFLALDLIPAYVGIYLLTRASVIRRREALNLDALRDYEGTVQAMRGRHGAEIEDGG